MKEYISFPKKRLKKNSRKSRQFEVETSERAIQFLMDYYGMSKENASEEYGLILSRVKKDHGKIFLALDAGFDRSRYKPAAAVILFAKKSHPEPYQVCFLDLPSLADIFESGASRKSVSIAS